MLRTGGRSYVFDDAGDRKSFGAGEPCRSVARGLDLEVERRILCITRTIRFGKSTLLNIIGGNRRSR